jgi:hypothetical protein
MGALRRRIIVATQPAGDEAGEARAVVEDDFHHFRVVVRQRGGRVFEAFGDGLRTPNALCRSASERLTEIVGMPLSAASAAVHERTDARLQCTHMIDLAGLAVAALAQGWVRRTYDATVPDRVQDRTRASLTRDGRAILAWEMEGARIAAPEAYAGVNIGGGFTRWARERLSLDETEAALVLRRAVFISVGRGVDLDAPGRRTGPMGGCWAWQPERAALATRHVGSTLDFTDRAEALARDDQDWLAFTEFADTVVGGSRSTKSAGPET